LKVLAEIPELGQGETAENPIPAPNARSKQGQRRIRHSAGDHRRPGNGERVLQRLARGALIIADDTRFRPGTNIEYRRFDFASPAGEW
jgi:hypothetical protein